jgi:hypothetical protein
MTMRIPLRFLFTAGLGAAAMYYFDPDRGRQRRALLQERLEQRRAGETAEDRARGTGSVETGGSSHPAAPKEGTPERPVH